jgi:hypothetical protein
MRSISIILLLLYWSVHLSGQSIEPVTLISGANYYSLSVQGVSLHSSFGELATETISAGDQHLSQGFLQTYFDLVPTAEAEDDQLKITIGPNPFTNQLTITKDQEDSLEAFLYDPYGRQVQKVVLTHLRTTVDLHDLPAGAYFLVVKQDGQAAFKTTKLIKV